MPSTCKFNFNKSKAAYFSGEIMSGTITLTTTNDKHVRDIRIIFLGEGKVKWDKSKTISNGNGATMSNTTYYTSKEKYINNNTMVHGDGILTAGTHTYTFKIPLPAECPSSFEGKYGHVRYEISLVINRYYRFNNIYKRGVTLIKTVDLNLNSGYKLPLVLDTISKLSWWPWAKEKICCKLQIPFRAYAPGQTVKYTLHIENQSMSDTQGYSLQLIKKIIFTAKSPQREERTSKTTLVSKSFKDPCLRLTNRTIEGVIQIPATPPTTPRSSIICVEYKFKVILHLPGCVSNPVIKVPIVIGTIPLRESLLTTQPTKSAAVATVAPTAPKLTGAELNSVAAELPPNYKDIKPPALNESICEKKKIQIETNGPKI